MSGDILYSPVTFVLHELLVFVEPDLDRAHCEFD